MKKTLFLATTIDGLIAKSDDQVTWSQDVWRNYYEYCSKVGYLMVGRRTFELMQEVGDADNLELKKFIIVSSQPKPPSMPGEWFTSHLAAFEYLQSIGCEHVVVGGGRQLANRLLIDNLIDEIQLDIEPKIYGTGVALFGETGGEYDLKLIETFQSGINTVRVRFAVVGKAE